MFSDIEPHLLGESGNSPMGVYYYYVNDSKKEYFCIDPAGIDIKEYALGRNIGSRALCYLILENDPFHTGIESHRLVGTWIGDRFFITGDEYGQTFDSVKSEFADIGQAVIEMLVQVCPYDLLAYGGTDWLLRLIETNGVLVTITSDMRSRLLNEFSEEHRLASDDDLKRVVSALRLLD